MPVAKFTKNYIESITPTKSRITYYDSSIKGLTLRVTPAGVKTYSLIHRNGSNKQKRYTIGKHPGISLAFAKKEAIRLLSAIADGENIEKKNQAQSDDKKLLTFGEYKIFFMKWFKENRRSYSNVITLFQNQLIKFDDIPLDQIDKKLINHWIYEQQILKVNKATINRKLVIIKSAISRAVDFGYLSENKLTGLKLLKIDNNCMARYLSKVEEKHLRLELSILENTMLKNIVLLALNTGLRKGEIFNLTWDDINTNLNLINVSGKVSKSGHSRQIPINKECKSVLESQKSCKSTGYVFTSPITGDKIVDVKKSFKTLLTNAGISNFRFHDLRHTFASKLVMRGVDLNTVRELLGHSDLKMTLRYAHLAPEHKQKAVDLL